MTTTCGCLPGTESNGWHEIRSAVCLAAELDLFRQAFDSAVRRWVRGGAS